MKGEGKGEKSVGCGEWSVERRATGRRAKIKESRLKISEIRHPASGIRYSVSVKPEPGTLEKKEKHINSITIKAPAKINIGLRITGVREDGYHTLESLFQMIDLYDNIKVEYPADELGINFTGPYGEGIEAKKSTVYKVWKLLKDKFSDIPDMKIIVEKNIPHGSGLGGGSSDAAFFAMALVKEFSLSISKDELAEMLSEIGADIPFFIYGPTSLVEGIGEVVTPVQFFKDYKIVLYYPDINISTADIYKKFDLSLTPHQKNIIFKTLLRRDCDFDSLSSCFYNDLESVVLDMYPRFDEVRKRLIEAGCKYVQMSGSGSSFFGFYKGDIDNKILDDLKETIFFCKPL